MKSPLFGESRELIAIEAEELAALTEAAPVAVFTALNKVLAKKSLFLTIDKLDLREEVMTPDKGDLYTEDEDGNCANS